MTFTIAAFDRSSSWSFEASSYKAAPKAPPSSPAILTAIAFAFEGTPRISLSSAAVAALLYNGAIGTALGFWAMGVANKELPAVVTSLGVLGMPVIGLGLSAIARRSCEYSAHIVEPADPGRDSYRYRFAKQIISAISSEADVLLAQ
jgi:hypothetical protein